MQEALNCGGKNKDDWVQGNVSLEFCRLKTKNNAELAQEEETAVEKVHITLKSGFPPPTSHLPRPHMMYFGGGKTCYLVILM